MAKSVRLRRLILGDINQIARLANNINIWNSLRDIFPYPYSVMDAVEFLDIVNEEEQHHTFGIEFNNQLCGIVRIMPRSDVYRNTAELGYWIGEEYWGKGIATDAIKKTVQYAFENCGFLRLEACVFSFNKGSARVLEKNGFELDGILKSSVIKNGIICDELLFSKLNHLKK